MNPGRWSQAWEIALIAVAIALQSVHAVTAYDAGFMYVDIVGVPAVTASLLLGIRRGVRVAFATGLAIYFIDSSALVGALLKVAATMSVIVTLRYATTRVTLLLAGVSAFLTVGGTSLTLRVLDGASLYLGMAAVACPLLTGIALYAMAPEGRIPQASPARSFAGRFLVPLLAAVLLRGTLMVFGDLFFAVPVFFHEPAAEAMLAYPPTAIFLWNGVQAVIDAATAWVVAGAVSRRRRVGPAVDGRSEPAAV